MSGDKGNSDVVSIVRSGDKGSSDTVSIERSGDKGSSIQSLLRGVGVKEVVI